VSDPPRKSSDPAFRLPAQVLERFRESKAPPADVEEVVELAAEAIRGPDDDETMVPCPGCEGCSLCKGSHMVSPAVRAKAISEIPDALDRTELDESGEKKP